MRRGMQVIGIAAAAALVLAAAGWSVALSSRPRVMVGVVVARGAATLDVRDQRSAAGELVVRGVTVPEPSWIVVTRPAAPDGPAVRVGLAHVRAGSSSGVTVTLGPGVPLNVKLTVTLQADHGTPGTFEFDPARFDASPDKPYTAGGAEVARTVVKDTPVTTLALSAGGAVSQEPQAPDARLDVADRLMVLDALTVDRVVAPGPAWVAVYNVDDSGQPYELVGSRAVSAGGSTGLRVPVDSPDALTDKLLVVLQEDSGTVGSFDFSFDDFAGSPDKPYALGGAELSREVYWRGFGMGVGNAGEGGGM